MAHAAHNSASLPLFEKYGGLGTLRAVIMDFYDRVIDSDEIGHFFEDVDLVRLVDHQTKFFTMVLGGPAQMADERLARAHGHLDVSHADFDEVVILLRSTLQDAGFDPEDLDMTLSAVEARRGLIVN